MESRTDRQAGASQFKTPLARAAGASTSGQVMATVAVSNEPVTDPKDLGPAANGSDLGIAASTTEFLQDRTAVSTARNPLRITFGALLFLSWAALTVVWLASTAYSVAHGAPMAAVTALAALVLLVVLGAMEGLEVAVIDCWQKLWPSRSTSYLARWLAARQLFVASIVTAATLLANRQILIVPGTSVQTTDMFALGVFDLGWTTFTVLWFAQIMPKHLGAVNPDRYLRHLHRRLFPVVEVVRMIGVSLPGEWMAYAIEYWLAWSAKSPDEADKLIKKHSLADIWCQLRYDLDEVERPKPGPAGK
jgi:hypothetical protein